MGRRAGSERLGAGTRIVEDGEPWKGARAEGLGGG